MVIVFLCFDLYILHTLQFIENNYLYSLCDYKPFLGDNMEEKICKGSYDTTNISFSNISNGAQDMVKHLLTVDYNMRFDFDKVLRHVWFDKDILMKQKVNDLMADFSKILKSSNMFHYNKENLTKKVRFCPCLTQATTSDFQCDKI